jgi:hypothetical protein
MTTLPPESLADSVPSGLDAVPLAVLAMQLSEPLEAIEAELAGHAFKVGGLKVVSAFRAAEFIAENERRQVQAAAEAAKRSAEALARHEETRAAAQAERANQEPRIMKFDIATRPIPGFKDAGGLPVERMTASAATDYEGATSTERPSRLDWLTGKGEGGSSFGPTPGQMLRDALARRDARKAAKEARAKGDQK